MSFDVKQFLNEILGLRHERKFLDAYELCKKSITQTGYLDKFILFELGIICYYIGLKQEGFRYLNEIMIGQNLTLSDIQMYNGSTINLKFYIEPIKSIITQEIKFPIKNNYYLSSASMFHTGNNQMIYNLRCINWNISSENGSYITYPIENSIYKYNTTNYCVFLSGTSVKGIHELKNLCIEPIVNDRQGVLSQFCGLEDLRIFDYDEKGCHFFCSSTQFHKYGIQKVAYGIFNNQGEIISLKVLELGNPDGTEKNWLPFKLGYQKYFVYGYEPFQIYSFDDDNNIKLVMNIKFTNFLGYIKGSAPPIPYEYEGIQGLLFTVHQNDININPRSYFHRFMWMSNDFTDFYISTLFYFENFPIEFNLSIFNTGTSIGITYTCMDINPKIKYIEYEEINKMLSWKHLD